MWRLYDLRHATHSTRGAVWVQKGAERLGRQSTLRPRGGPRMRERGRAPLLLTNRCGGHEKMRRLDFLDERLWPLG
jgi:hypothetical protein